MSIRVLFNRHEEFLDELEEVLASDVEGNIVRVSRVRRSTSFAQISHLLIVAGFVLAGRLIVCEEFCGQMFGFASPEEDRVHERARSVGLKIETRAQQLGYKTGCGVYEEVK
jgi:hypothetical protein